jgi:CDGSH-type Zn-finger protein
MPPDDPVRRADTIKLEDLAQYANEEGLVKFCRCWKSKTFPLCDNSHLDHNEECGDNAAPVVISGFEPILRQWANNGGVKSTVPPDAPTKRVDMLSVAEIGAKVRADGDVKFCRCWKSAEFPFCDDSHDGTDSLCLCLSLMSSLCLCLCLTLSLTLTLTLSVSAGHNDACEAAGSRDNAAPVVLTTGLPADKRGLDKVQTLAEGTEPMLDETLAGFGRANNYSIPSNMPPGAPTKRGAPH